MYDKTILIIEDDKSIRNFLRISLKAFEYKTIEADSGVLGLSLFMSFNPDVVILDLGLPDIDGMEVLKQIRQDRDVPVIIVSARSEEREKVAALDNGADDYVTKPFGAHELFARIRACLRRHRPAAISNELSISGLHIDFDKRKVTINGNDVHFTPLEYKMLVLLAGNAGKVLTHKHIQKEVWGSDTTDDYQTLRVFMAGIRKKIESDTMNPRYITTEVGIGYRFADE